MSETYTTGGDTLQSVDHPNWQGQTFVIRENHVLQFIDLEMRGVMKITEPVIQVFYADINGHPWGSALSRNRFTVEKKCGMFTTGRVRFSMIPFLLEMPARFVIIVCNFPALLGNPASWQYDKGDATYPRGYRISSADGGDTWTNHYNDDFMFAEFGDPPLPKPEPPPPIDNFATLGLQKIHLISSVFIILSTSVPCHLTLYYTDQKPQRHKTSRIERGLEIPWGAYFCFVAWKEVEQMEPGDTLYHTFCITPWEYCQTKWFTIRGNVDSILSPSVGPIFEQHHPGATPPQKFEFYDDPKQTYSSIYEPRQSGQTFTPTQTHLLTKVYTLMTRATNTYPNLYLEIREAPDDTPTGPILSSGSTSWAVIPDGAVPAWVETPMSQLILKPGVKYAIIARTAGIGAGVLRWWRRYFNATYPRGIRIYSTDSGNTWSKFPLHDFLFEEWGIPPTGEL